MPGIHRLGVAALVGLGALVASGPFDESRASAPARSVRTIPVTDRSWYFSPCNWDRTDSAFAQTQNPGAYFAIAFTGTTAALALDLSPLDRVPSSEWPRIRWQ